MMFPDLSSYSVDSKSGRRGGEKGGDRAGQGRELDKGGHQASIHPDIK